MEESIGVFLHASREACQFLAGHGLELSDAPDQPVRAHEGIQVKLLIVWYMKVVRVVAVRKEEELIVWEQFSELVLTVNR